MFFASSVSDDLQKMLSDKACPFNLLQMQLMCSHFC